MATKLHIIHGRWGLAITSRDSAGTVPTTSELQHSRDKAGLVRQPFPLVTTLFRDRGEIVVVSNE